MLELREASGLVASDRIAPSEAVDFTSERSRA
jgi:hypothetical protein